MPGTVENIAEIRLVKSWTDAAAETEKQNSDKLPSEEIFLWCGPNVLKSLDHMPKLFRS